MSAERVSGFAAQTAVPTSASVRVPLIELLGIHKRFGTATVLDGIDLLVPTGTYLALRGASGAGKTTLLGILGLLEAPSDGVYRFRGEPTSLMDDRQLSNLRNQALGFVFQQFSLVPGLSAWQNVARPLTFTQVPRRKHKRKAVEILEWLGLSSRVEHRPSQLSGGEQQRVAIARALINNPEVILADEPTGNLPPDQWDPILEAFDRMHVAGKTVILVTHSPDVARRASHSLWLGNGKLKDPDATQKSWTPETAQPTTATQVGTPVRSSRRSIARIRLEFLGRVQLFLDGNPLPIQPRQADILTFLVANPQGLTGEQLLLLVYGEAGHRSTLKAAISKLRKIVPVGSQPYRLEVESWADFIELESALKSGNVDNALDLYSGPLLVQSEAPGIVELRERLDDALRHATLSSNSGEFAFRLAEMLVDDLELWETAAAWFDPDDPRRALALARAELLRREWR